MAATLSREDMERAIREGGSVLYQGRTISRVEDLPNEAALAQGDRQREEAVRASIDAQIAALTAQRAQLGAGTATAPQQESAASGEGRQETEPPATEPPATPPRKRS